MTVIKGLNSISGTSPSFWNNQVSNVGVNNGGSGYYGGDVLTVPAKRLFNNQGSAGTNADLKITLGSGDLDDCNFGDIYDEKVYFATNEFPFFPRCLWGNPSRYFLR